MKAIKLVIIALFVSSCGRQGEKSFELVIEGDLLKSHYYEFLNDAETYNRYVDTSSLAVLRFEDTLPNEAIGICRKFSNGRREVAILSTMKGRLMLKALVYHELAHCLLDLKHSDNVDSLMYPALSYNAVSDSWPTKVRILMESF